MPCDTRLLTLNEMLRSATERQSASDERLAQCRTQIERAKVSLRAAQQSLDNTLSARASFIRFQKALAAATADFIAAQAAHRKIAEERSAIESEIAKLSR